MQLGISSYTYTWSIGVGDQKPSSPLDAHALLDKAKELNVKLVQLADNIPLERWTDEALREFGHNANDMGIGLEVGGRGLTPERLGQYIHIAKILECPILRFVIDGVDYEPDHETIQNIIKKELNSLRNAGIFLAIENHDRFLSRELAQFIHQTSPLQVGVCLDSVNSLGAGEGIQEVLGHLLPLTINFHIKDFGIKRKDHQMGFDVFGTPAGEGLLDIPGTIKKLKHLRRCGSCILELWTPPERDIEETAKKEQAWARQSIAYLQTLGLFEN
jgi:sugar phosphate isomerase/epimerase